MENDQGSQDGDELEFDLLARMLGATDEPPRLLVLNACEGFAGADNLLRTVPAVVGMAASIGDAAAVVFAARFYSAIASAQSVASAVEQARVAMQAASLDDCELPQIKVRKGLNPQELILVHPISGAQVRPGGTGGTAVTVDGGLAVGGPGGNGPGAGNGGSATSFRGGLAVGGPGGGGGPYGGAGAGGAVEATEGVFSVGGEGGEAPQYDRGGRGGRSGTEIAGVPNIQLPDGTRLWDYGRGGDGAPPPTATEETA